MREATMGNNNSAALMFGVATIPAGVIVDDDYGEAFLEDYGASLDNYRRWYDPRIPRSPSDAEIPAWGFYVAVGGSGEDDYPYLDPFALDDIEAAYGQSLADARARWSAFAAWAATRGVIFESPRLYFTLTETA